MHLYLRGAFCNMLCVLCEGARGSSSSIGTGTSTRGKVDVAIAILGAVAILLAVLGILLVVYLVLKRSRDRPLTPPPESPPEAAASEEAANAEGTHRLQSHLLISNTGCYQTDKIRTSSKTSSTCTMQNDNKKKKKMTTGKRGKNDFFGTGLIPTKIKKTSVSTMKKEKPATKTKETAKSQIWNEKHDQPVFALRVSHANSLLSRNDRHRRNQCHLGRQETKKQRVSSALLFRQTHPQPSPAPK